MGRRKILMAIAALVAAMGVAMVFLYVRGADNRADQRFAARSVLVATSAISPGETLSAAKAAGKIGTRTVTAGSLVPGSVSDLSAIPTNDVALTTIYPGEQLLQSKFGTSDSGAMTLGIPKGDVAVSAQLDDPGRVAGFVNPGDHVTIFVIVSKAGGNTVRVLLPNVTVIGVGNTTNISTTTTDTTGAQTTESIPRTLMTFAVNQADAQKIIFATRAGGGSGTGGGVESSLTFGLLTNTSKINAGMQTGFANLFN